MMTTLQTERLLLRDLTVDDAPFILALLNEPSYHQNIGDRGLRTLDDARQYLLNGEIANYAANGFGLWAVTPREGGAPMGLCGLVNRKALDDVDLGYAFLPAHWGQGYAVEAARAVVAHAFGLLGLKRLVAIVTPNNARSTRLLEKVGLRFERLIPWGAEAEQLALYAIEPTSLPGLHC